MDPNSFGFGFLVGLVVATFVWFVMVWRTT